MARTVCSKHHALGLGAGAPAVLDESDPPFEIALDSGGSSISVPVGVHQVIEQRFVRPAAQVALGAHVGELHELPDHV